MRDSGEVEMDYTEFNAQRKGKRDVTWDVLEFIPEDSIVVQERELSDEERREFERLCREGRF